MRRVCVQEPSRHAPVARRARTSSPWSAGSARRRLIWRRTTHSWPVRWARWSSSPSTDVMDTPAGPQGVRARTVSIRGDQTATSASKYRRVQRTDVSVAVCSLLAAGVGLNLHGVQRRPRRCPGRRPSSRRSTAFTGSARTSRWHLADLAAQTIDSKIAELIDSRVWPHGRSTAATRRSAPVTRSSSTRSSTCSARH